MEISPDDFDDATMGAINEFVDAAKAEGVPAKCPKCGAEMQVHEGPNKCPKCGAEFPVTFKG